MKIDDPTEAEKLVADIIRDAEDFQDPLDGLVERTKSHPGAAFVPEVLERLAELKRDDRAAFEALRAQLKGAGCRVTALDEAMSEESGETGGRSPTQADVLLELAQAAQNCSIPLMVRVSPISTSMATVKPGRSAPRDS